MAWLAHIILVLALGLGAQARASGYVREYVCRTEAAAAEGIGNPLVPIKAPKDGYEERELRNRNQIVRDLLKAQIASFQDWKTLQAVDVYDREFIPTRDEISTESAVAYSCYESQAKLAARWLGGEQRITPDTISHLRRVLHEETGIARTRLTLYRKLAENLPLRVTLDFSTYRDLDLLARETNREHEEIENFPDIFDKEQRDLYLRSRRMAKRLVKNEVLSREMRLMLADQLAFIIFLEDRRPFWGSGESFDRARMRFSNLVILVNSLMEKLTVFYYSAR